MDKQRTWGNVIGTVGIALLLLTAAIKITILQTETQSSLLNLRQDVIKMNKDLREYVDMKASDRWSKTDDELFMLKYTNTNNLRMPVHGRKVER